MFVVFFSTSPTIYANTKRNSTINNNNYGNNESNKAQNVIEIESVCASVITWVLRNFGRYVSSFA